MRKRKKRKKRKDLKIWRFCGGKWEYRNNFSIGVRRPFQVLSHKVSIFLISLSPNVMCEKLGVVGKKERTKKKCMSPMMEEEWGPHWPW